jgi:hypothetical protein
MDDHQTKPKSNYRNCVKGYDGRRFAAVLFTVYLCFAFGLTSSSAVAGTVSNDRPFLFSFDGHDTTLGKFTGTAPNGVNAVAVDDVSGDVYVIDGEGGGEGVDKFNAAGEAKDFPAGPAADTSSLLGPKAGESFKDQYEFFFSFNSGLAVDNSGGSGGPGEGEQGRLYVSGSAGGIDAFDPEGNFLWTLPLEEAGKEISKGVCGIAVDTEGHLWAGAGNREVALEFATSGSPPKVEKEVPITNGNKNACKLGLGKGGELYVGLDGGSPSGLDKYIGGIYSSTLTTERPWGIGVDQTSLTGHVFEGGQSQNNFREFESSGKEVPGSPFGHDLIGETRGLAYNPSLDRVYVSDLDAEKVKVFGPKASGTVPDVAIEPTTEVGSFSATANGVVNPQGVPNDYHVEVKVPVSEIQLVRAETSEKGSFRLSFEGKQTTLIDCHATPEAVQAALEALATIGKGNVSVSSSPGGGCGNYEVAFIGAFTGVDVPALVALKESLTPGGVEVITVGPGLQNGNSSWATATSSAPGACEPAPLPQDSSPHQVSCQLEGLKTNTTYQVRLVGTNSENQLDSYSAPDTFTTLSPPKPVVGCSTSEIDVDSAHLSCTIDPHGDATTWKVLHAAVSGADKAQCEALLDSQFQLLKEGSIPKEEAGAVGIEAALEGLTYAQTYCVRVIATNGSGDGLANEAFTTPTDHPPSELETAFAAPRLDTSARINGRINPEGEADFKYSFEVSEDGSSWTALPERESNLDAREKIVVAQELSGLKPGTTYHYRLAGAENEGGPSASPGEEKTFTTRTKAELEGPIAPPNCPNEAVRKEQHTTYLGLCRGIELLNSPDKGNQAALAVSIDSGAGDSAMTPDGQQALWEVLGGSPGGNTPTGDTFLAERGPSGWESTSLLPPASQQLGKGKFQYRYFAAAPSFARFLFRTEPVELNPNLEQQIFVRLGPGQAEEALSEAGAPLESFEMSADGAHVLAVEVNAPHQLLDVGEGTQEVISLLPEGEQASCGVPSGNSGLQFSFAAGAHQHPGYRWASSDASRVYFQARPNKAGEPAQCEKSAPYGLYERNREGEGATTLIDAGSFGQSPEFIRTTPDGKSAYFLTTSQLDAADTNADADVYRWDEGEEASSCLTCASPDAAVTEVVVSDDFSHVYFESLKGLVPGRGRAGDQNVYALSDGALRFVADPVLLSGGEATLRGHSRLSADGNVLVFSSVAAPRLTADETPAQCPSLKKGDPPGSCYELYRYDDRDGAIECLSCTPSGQTTHTYGSPTGFLIGMVGFFGLSGDGSTTAFPTAEPLVPEDVNHDTDIYEWRDGALRLLTDGISDYLEGLSAPVVTGIDADGSNIMFSLVKSGLTGFEQDGLTNLYDARIGGGFLAPAPPTHCSGDSCQGPLEPAPPPARLGTANYSGPGNAKGGRPACARGKVKRKGRCVKRHRHRRHGAAGHSTNIKHGRNK